MLHQITFLGTSLSHLVTHAKYMCEVRYLAPTSTFFTYQGSCHCQNQMRLFICSFYAIDIYIYVDVDVFDRLFWKWICRKGAIVYLIKSKGGILTWMKHQSSFTKFCTWFYNVHEVVEVGTLFKDECVCFFHMQ